MTDESYGVARLPISTNPLNYEKANAIEDNLRALILAWPEFISETRLYSVGSYGYFQLNEKGSAAPGVEVTTVRHLPILLVLLTGDGLENLHWESDQPWEEINGVPAYRMTETSVYNANAAFQRLIFSATGDVDAVVRLAGYNPDWEPEELMLAGLGKTRLLFHNRASWGLAKAKYKTWGGAKPLTWDEAAALRKEDLNE